MSHRSDPKVLALHSIRIQGGPSLSKIADRFDLDYQFVHDYLGQSHDRGWVTPYTFAGKTSWSITEVGKAENERQLAAELDQAGARAVVTAAHAAFMPLNHRHGLACTQWQIRPTPTAPFAMNDHTDRRWDNTVVRTLAGISRELDDLCAMLSGALVRFDGHAARYTNALNHVRSGDHDWVDSPDRASCHILWIQLHEDLLATLGIPRGTDTTT